MAGIETEKTSMRFSLSVCALKEACKLAGLLVWPTKTVQLVKIVQASERLIFNGHKNGLTNIRGALSRR